MKCTLVFLPVWKPLTPPLQLASLKASLLASGIQCRARDYTVTVCPGPGAGFVDDATLVAEVMRDEAALACWTQEILTDAPEVVGFSVVTSNFEVTRAVARRLRQAAPAVTIVCGGPAFVQPETSKSALEFSDYVVQGEGEQVLPELVRRRSALQEIAELPQVWFKGEDGEPRYSGSGELPELDRNALADFEDFDFDQYVFRRRLPLLFSRGCVLSCSFCENKLAYKTQRTRSARNVFSELVRNAARHRIREYTFNDDSLISRITIGEIDRFVDLVLAEELIIPWSIYGTRVEKLVTEPLVRKLHKSGLYDVAIGVESFSSEVQRAMGKSSSHDLADRFVRMFADEGINTRLWLIYGYPSETDSQFQETLDWLSLHGHLTKSLWINGFHVNGCYLANRPGTVAFYGGNDWSWRSEHSTVERRRDRFLRLMEVVSTLQRAQESLEFSVVDPYSVKSLTAWSPEIRLELEQRWAELDRCPPAGS